MRKTREERPHPMEVSVDQVSHLMQAMKQNFIHILPKKPVMVQSGANQAFIPPKVTLELLEQYEITLQLLVQNILFCEEDSTKQMSMDLFDQIIIKKNQITDTPYLPEFDVFLNDFVGLSNQKFGSNELQTLSNNFDRKQKGVESISGRPNNRQVCSFKPQVSILQAAILELGLHIFNFANQ